MKYRSNSHVPPFDVTNITETIEQALASAGLDTTSGPMRGVTDTIRRALSSGGLMPVPSHGVDTPFVDVEARVVGHPDDEEGRLRPEPAISARETPGTFVTCEFSNQAGMRTYKLYVPARTSDSPMPMVVMLHGCTQSAEDFAAGTKMNRLAEEHGFLVVYPEQAAHANPSKCWNWFRVQDQVRDQGEPSLIAGIVREVAARHGADLRRIFVAGLSAGASMALVLGETYPELFAGIGVHSGLAYGSAQDIPSALLAMKGGRSGLAQLQSVPANPTTKRKAVQAVPIIVFHGDRDHTVQHANGTEIVRQASDAHAADAGAALLTSVEHGIASAGRSYSRTVHTDAGGRPRMESWTIHGGGHAWSGGDARGSYTDRNGPDASAEMVRFFLAQPRAGSA